MRSSISSARCSSSNSRINWMGIPELFLALQQLSNIMEDADRPQPLTLNPPLARNEVEEATDGPPPPPPARKEAVETADGPSNPPWARKEQQRMQTNETKVKCLKGCNWKDSQSRLEPKKACSFQQQECLQLMKCI